MMTKILCLGALGVAASKAAYRLLMKTTPVETFKVLGNGNYVSVVYSQLGRKWVSPNKDSEFYTLPNSQLTHICDLIIHAKPSYLIFRPRAYHEFLNNKLNIFGLEVIPTQNLPLTAFFSLVSSISKDKKDKTLIRINLWKEVIITRLKITP
jgi:hypothetical protein